MESYPKVAGLWCGSASYPWAVSAKAPALGTPRTLFGQGGGIPTHAFSGFTPEHSGILSYTLVIGQCERARTSGLSRPRGALFQLSYTLMLRWITFRLCRGRYYFMSVGPSHYLAKLAVGQTLDDCEIAIRALPPLHQGVLIFQPASYWFFVSLL